MQKLFQDLWIFIFGTQKPVSPTTHLETSQASLPKVTPQDQDRPVKMDDLLRALGADL